MCRLFGLYANKLVDVYFSFYGSPVKSFEELSRKNPHGWGIAWLDAGGWHIYKESKPLHSSTEAEELIRKHVRGRMVVSHVRLVSTGDHRREDTHPWHYRGWVFAHNGTIHARRRLLRLLREEYRDLEGDTDSEAFFHLVVQEVHTIGYPVEGIIEAVRKIAENDFSFSSLNFIASDGKSLYALRYATTSPDYYTLYYIKRPGEGLELRRLSKETRQLIQAKLAHGEKAIIIASEPMSEEQYWEPIPNKQLLVVDATLNTKLMPVKI